MLRVRENLAFDTKMSDIRGYLGSHVRLSFSRETIHQLLKKSCNLNTFHPSLVRIMMCIIVGKRLLNFVKRSS